MDTRHMSQREYSIYPGCSKVLDFHWMMRAAVLVEDVGTPYCHIEQKAEMYF